MLQPAMHKCLPGPTTQASVMQNTLPTFGRPTMPVLSAMHMVLRLQATCMQGASVQML